MADGGSPVDGAVLETIYDRAQTHSLVGTVRAERTDATISRVVIALDLDQYPDHIQDARLEIRWFRNDDYSFHYVETHTADEVWQCRWDRHTNPHATRTHFHPPPAADSSDAVSDQPAEVHPMGLFTRTFANIRQRIGDLWER
mgnify:CR=1 FL=1